ncbi:hypothetical protein DFH06DRAFT_1142060 [Mycena polygramma]|nr:hypothetical protein DFH06DRAFT_1142060 [Mycena polygramma]
MYLPLSTTSFTKTPVGISVGGICTPQMWTISTGWFWSGLQTSTAVKLKALAAAMPVRADLHEPHRTIQSLSPYDHLQRIFRLCETHFYRNITSCAVPPSIKSLMRSLLCLEHPNWDGTLAAIEEKGGKAGSDWVKDKQSTHFAFAAICWERSFIPKVVWMAGDSNTNLIESVHRDVNREGVHCTLLGGLQKGQSFDALKMRTLEITETYGIKGTYFSGHISENAFVNLRRRDNAQRRQLLTADRKLESINEKLQKSYDSLCKIRHTIVHRITTNLANHDISVALARLTEQAERTLASHLKFVEEGQEWIETNKTSDILLVLATKKINGHQSNCVGDFKGGSAGANNGANPLNPPVGADCVRARGAMVATTISLPALESLGLGSESLALVVSESSNLVISGHAGRGLEK